MAGKKAYLRPVGSMLAPVNEASEEIIRGLGTGEVQAVLSRPRQLGRHKFFWALCGKLSKALQAAGRDHMTPDHVAHLLKIATGHCIPALLPAMLQRETGQVYGLAAKSIDFHTMDEIEFNEFLNRVIYFVVSELMPGLGALGLSRDIELLMDPVERRAFVMSRGYK